MNLLLHVKLATVKTLRVWLLVLLTVLLPLRGALAAAMMCPAAGVGVQSEIALADAPSGHEHDHGDGHGHGHQAHGPAGHAHAEHSGASHDQANADEGCDDCNLCSASCSAAAVVSGESRMAEPQDVATVFHHLYGPGPTFIPDGQERPPRSI